MQDILRHPDGELHIEDQPNGLRRLTVKCFDSSSFVPIASYETFYPRSLIELTLAVTGPAWVCDAIAREEDPKYVRDQIRTNLFAFVDETDIRGKRVLDFGCGAGASTISLAELLPDCQITGVELSAKLLVVAQSRAQHRRVLNASFHASPSGTELPPGLGQFDFCMMSAVIEHVLPEERPVILPKVWAALRPGGVLFVNQTPHRYFPVETHSTGLPLVNYFPDRLAFAVARRWSRNRCALGQSNEELLRGGFRGATESEILRIVGANNEAVPELLPPRLPGCRDRVDLWYSLLSNRWHATKTALRLALRVIHNLTGTVFAQNLLLAIRKTPYPVSE
jgi:ubiquinone/menaquinone biosynthesis C-methylase UbiE